MIIKHGIEWRAGRKLKHLTYADDLCLFADDLEVLSGMNRAAVCEAGRVGLIITTRETEIIKMRSADTCQAIIKVKTLQEVDKFTYLRCEIDKDGDIQHSTGSAQL